MDNSEILSFYKSLGSPAPDVVEDVIQLSISDGVVPAAVRYIETHGAFRGAIEGTNGNHYYFNYHPDASFRIIKAETPEQMREVAGIHKYCKQGVDLVKAEAVDEDLEDTDKAGNGGGGGVQSGHAATATMSDAQSVASQNSAITQVHPGGVGGTTPDLPQRGRNWHGEDLNRSVWAPTDLLKSWGEHLQATSSVRIGPPRANAQEQKFLMEFYGMSQAEAAKVTLTPGQKAKFNVWTQSAASKSVKHLNDWRNKKL